MRVLQLKIENCISIKSANLTFDGRTLLAGGNSVVKARFAIRLTLYSARTQKAETSQVPIFAVR